jgi:hypothetical protein
MKKKKMQELLNINPGGQLYQITNTHALFGFCG